MMASIRSWYLVSLELTLKIHSGIVHLLHSALVLHFCEWQTNNSDDNNNNKNISTQIWMFPDELLDTFVDSTPKINLIKHIFLHQCKMRIPLTNYQWLNNIFFKSGKIKLNIDIIEKKMKIKDSIDIHRLRIDKEWGRDGVREREGWGEREGGREGGMEGGWKERKGEKRERKKKEREKEKEKREGNSGRMKCICRIVATLMNAWNLLSVLVRSL